MGDGDVLKSDVKLLGTLEEVGADTVGDGLALGDELGGVELGDNGLQDFVSDRWEDTLIVILAEVLVYLSDICASLCYIHLITYLINLWELLDVWSGQDSEGQADHLEILGSGGCGDVSWLCAHIVDDGLL